MDALSQKKAVLLINLGTPDSLEVSDVKAYLREFLSDPRVVEIPKIAWLPLLYGVIANVKGPKSAKNYAKIWDKEENDSPLRIVIRNQAEKLQAQLENKDVHVDFAMRYGKPSIESKINELHENGYNEILIAPLYPQYSATTTATVVDEVNRLLRKKRFQPAVSVMPPYFAHPAYIEALKSSIEEKLAAENFEPDAILASYHGLPEVNCKKGDPYDKQCYETSRLMAEALGLPEEKFITSFQSRFGAQKWLMPYTSQKVEELAKSGVKKLAVLAPGFSADCLETLEEICMEIRDEFIEAGGEEFIYIPCLNDSDIGQEMLYKLVEPRI